MEPIICEVCYDFFNSPAQYLSHYRETHEEIEEEDELD